MSETQTLPGYKFKDLASSDGIRILVLQPASTFTSPLRGNLIHTTRRTIHEDDSGRLFYNAMSYACGAPDFTKNLLINADSNTNTNPNTSANTLKITPNVDSMLRHMREPDSAVKLWVDAICIHQSNIEEKNSQVQQMSETYRLAAQVVVWLGEDDGTVYTAFAFLVAMEKMRQRAGTQDTGQERAGMATGVAIALQSFLGNEKPNVLERLLHRAWFGRRWVLQEVALARQCVVVCGKNHFPSSTFRTGIEVLDQAQGGWKVMRARLVDREAQLAMKTMLSLNRHSGNLLDLLWDLDAAQCQENSDRFYALLGMARGGAPADTDVANSVEVKIRSDEDLERAVHRFSLWAGASSQSDPATSTAASSVVNGALGVDYRIPWHQIFTDVATYFVKSGAFAAITRHLHAFASLSEANAEWPSWVPDWTRSRRAEPKDGLDKRVTMVPLLTIKDGGLHVLARQVGEVESVTTGFPRDPAEFRQALRSVLPEEIDCEADPETYGLTVGKLIRTGLSSGLCGPIYEETDQLTGAFIVNDLSSNSIAEIVFNPRATAQDDNFLSGIWSSMESAALFTMSDDRVGLRGKLAKVGDLVVIIDHYHRLPEINQPDITAAAVLRPARERGSDPSMGGHASSTRPGIDEEAQYQLIGPCVFASPKRSVNEESSAGKKRYVLVREGMLVARRNGGIPLV